MNHKVLIIFQTSTVELYGVIAYLSQNASKNRKWILSLYTVLILLFFLNFGLLSLGLGLYFYLFLLWDVGGGYIWSGLLNIEPNIQTAIKTKRLTGASQWPRWSMSLM